VKFDGAAWEASINDAAALLRANNQGFWADRLQNAINSPTYVRTFFGGMGSLNDLRLQNPADDKRLKEILDDICRLADVV
jgi:hypothetical protein